MRTLAPFFALALLAGCGGEDIVPPTPAGAGGAGGQGAGGGAAGSAGTAGAAGAPTMQMTVSDDDASTFVKPPDSCAYHCPDVSTCAENKTPYVCQNLGDWLALPHAASCKPWDGTLPSKSVKGTCTVTEASGEAARYAGVTEAGERVLPDGRRLKPLGQTWIFDEPDLHGGMTTVIAAVPGTKWAIAIDTGPGDHAVRALDTTALGAPGGPVASHVKYADPASIGMSVAFVAPDLVLVGTNQGIVQGLTFDAKTGKLTPDAARSPKLPPGSDGSGKPAPFWVGGLAVSPDGKRLVVTGVSDGRFLTYDIDPASPTAWKQRGELSLGATDTFAVAFDPNDPSGKHAYVSLWASSAVAEIDVSDLTAPALVRNLPTDKDPEGLAFLDARWMLSANALGDTLTLIDRVAGTTTPVPLPFEKLHGTEPSMLAYDAKNARLYATLAGVNAVGAWSVDTSKDTPVFNYLGRIPTQWWPGGVAVRDDGALVIASLRGKGEGPSTTQFDLSTGEMTDVMRGGVQVVPSPSLAELGAGDAYVTAAISVASQPGQPTVSCPTATYDFPIPQKTSDGPSKVITKVVLIVRENKNFDGIFGDVPGVNGDATKTYKATSAEQDQIWNNLRTVARTFAMSDNYYTDAVQSAQGHMWTTYGRTSDFEERTWAVSGGGTRDARTLPLGGVSSNGRPVEGSIFEWLGTHQVDVSILGEAVGSPSAGVFDHLIADPSYPGGPFQNIDYNDLRKACYAAGRLRVECNLPAFTYMTLPNDHTHGLSPKQPTPETYCAVNDEATGMILDAITHSPEWPNTLVLITEDDPQDGGEHVDHHRTPLVAVSPWVRRGFVSKTHIDVASVHKLVAHVFGVPYPSVSVANAALPLDLFTSTPDYTPYSMTTRTWPLACGVKTTIAEQRLTASWDFHEVDEQPGLSAQITRWMRGKQLDTLPPRLLEQVEAREKAQANGDDLTSFVSATRTPPRWAGSSRGCDRASRRRRDRGARSRSPSCAGASSTTDRPSRSRSRREARGAAFRSRRETPRCRRGRRGRSRARTSRRAPP